MPKKTDAPESNESIITGFQIPHTVDNFGEYLLQCRTVDDMTQTAIAAEAGWDQPAVSLYERGRLNPSPERMATLAKLIPSFSEDWGNLIVERINEAALEVLIANEDDWVTK